MYTVLIADDEKVIREGLSCIINWTDYGFTICGEASNGEETLNLILKKQPNLVLLDINMPKLYGINVIKLARDRGYQGKFIILSGYSDFKYAQSAIKLGVNEYLTKPIDEDELSRSIESIKTTLISEAQNLENIFQYKQKAKNTILHELITESSSLSLNDIQYIHLYADKYQILLYENYSYKFRDVSYDFADILRLTNTSNLFDYFIEDNMNVILLKGDVALKKFNRFLEHYDRIPQKGSPLDSIFIAYGRPVNHIFDISISYKEAAALIKRRFFCKKGQHTLGFPDFPAIETKNIMITREIIEEYAFELADYIQCFNRQKVNDSLIHLENHLYNVRNNISETKLFLADLYLLIKERINRLYSNIQIPFPTNSEIIQLIQSKFYLYEIIQFYSSQFEMIMNALGAYSRNSILEDILYYIEHNFHNHIKLETIAPLFGYNSAYLGKLIHKTVGKNFNSYLDEIRIEHSKKLLSQQELKVYEIAECIGYNNVDYFHKKFKKYVGMSPAEYRKSMKEG
ncbi:response regulator [Anaerosacchariphilus polymeriproducens]|uniref:Stage 0 sporulation protein A homolog n=1 Tax=Anaerosacchariphilus polymeriproducens TaxID=1812858 RepID=A0A371AW59_9FIRM|nr:response regulator [Anaerosacchariphilus polymeriproducens]RDU23807.1 DNA-binding response regulator [Anaerosacchariphilus polymeriproducens]